MARTSAGGIQVSELQDAVYTYAEDAEASDSYAITIDPAPSAYTPGQMFTFKANTANTGVASLDVNGLGAITIKKRTGLDLADNDIKEDSIVTVVYDGTNFQMISMLANAPAGSGDMTAVVYDPAGGAEQVAFASDLGTAAAEDVDAFAAALGADDNYVTDAEKTKLGHISVTQAVDLDALETAVAALDSATVLKGSWDASAGTFPGAGSAQAGWSYIVSVAGTVDSVAFAVNDRIIAITDNASTGTFAANWFKADYTDQVLSVNTQTGAVVLDADDIDDTSTANKFTTAGDISKLAGIEASADVTDADNVAAAGALMDSELTDITFVKALSDADAATLNTGTSTTAVPTADSLAGSYAGTKSVSIQIAEGSTDLATGDGQAYFMVPAELNGMNLVGVRAGVVTAGTTGTTDFQIYNLTQTADMLSTKLTIDSGETTSATAATAAAIDTSNDDVATNDILRIDVDAVSTTAPAGGFITLSFRLP